MNLDEDEEPIDAYKDWLANMHRQYRFTGKCHVVLFSIYWRSLCTNICFMDPNLKDIERDDTTKTYKEWLRVERLLDDTSNITYVPKCLLLIFSQSYYIWHKWPIFSAVAYVDSNQHTQVEHSSQDSNPTPPVSRPSHAWRFIPQGEGTSSKYWIFSVYCEVQLNFYYVNTSLIISFCSVYICFSWKRLQKDKAKR
jgi:hypothetical protein